MMPPFFCQSTKFRELGGSVAFDEPRTRRSRSTPYEEILRR